MTRQTTYRYPHESETSSHGEMTLPAYSQHETGVVEVEGPSSQPASTTPDQTSYPSVVEEKRRSLVTTASEEAPPPHPATLPEPVGERSGSPTGSGSNDFHLSHGISVTTNRKAVTSGFPFPHALAQHNVSIADWSLFSSEITNVAHMQEGDWAHVLAGAAGTFFISGFFLGWFALIPAFCATGALRRRREKRNLGSAMRNGALDAIIAQWNRDYFAPRGLVVHLEAPGHKSFLDGAEIVTSDSNIGQFQHSGMVGSADAAPPQVLSDDPKARQKQVKYETKLLEKQKKHEKKAVAKQEKWDRKDQEEMVHKGRIVIMPLRQRAEADSRPQPDTSSGTAQ